MRELHARLADYGAASGLPDGFPAGATADPGSSATTIAGLLGDLSELGLPVQFNAQPGASAISPNPSAVQRTLGAGQPLHSPVASRMSAAFGFDISGIRIHTDADSASMSRSLHARAFTVGNHIAFGHGEYSPGTFKGDALIAHELAHTYSNAAHNKEVPGK